MPTWGLSAFIFANFLGGKWHLIILFCILLFYQSLEWFLKLPKVSTHIYERLVELLLFSWIWRHFRFVCKSFSSQLFSFNFLFPYLSFFLSTPFHPKNIFLQELTNIAYNTTRLLTNRKWEEGKKIKPGMIDCKTPVIQCEWWAMNLIWSFLTVKAKRETWSASRYVELEIKAGQLP